MSVLTRGDVAGLTQSIRVRFPRTRRELDGYFYPPRKEATKGDPGVLLFGSSATIEVDPARTVAGVVRDAATGEPVAGLQIKTADAFGAGHATTDSEGHYRLLRAEDESSIVVYTQTNDETLFDRRPRADGCERIGRDRRRLRCPARRGHRRPSTRTGTECPIVSSSTPPGLSRLGAWPAVGGLCDVFSSILEHHTPKHANRPVLRRFSDWLTKLLAVGGDRC